jgi:hypothetical protein
MIRNYVDDIVEKYIGALITARMWQTLANQYCPAAIPAPTIEAAHNQHRQQLDPLWIEYMKERQQVSDPEVAVQTLLSKLRGGA